MQVPGTTNAQERVQFRFAEDMSGIEIQRIWDYKGVVLRVYASESANWVLKKSSDDTKGNLTVTALGNWYKKTNAWVLPWKQAVA